MGYVKVGNGPFRPSRVSIIPPPPQYDPLTKNEKQNIRNMSHVKWGNKEYRELYNRVKHHVTNDPYHNPPKIVNYNPPEKLSNLALPNITYSSFGSPKSPTKRNKQLKSPHRTTSRSR